MNGRVAFSGTLTPLNVRAIRSAHDHPIWFVASWLSSVGHSTTHSRFDGRAATLWSAAVGDEHILEPCVIKNAS